MQSFHWVNAEATLHPLVYFSDSAFTKSETFCVIKDILYNTVAINTFQKILISNLKEKLMDFKTCTILVIDPLPNIK